MRIALSATTVIQLTKRTEYGLIALVHLADAALTGRDGAFVSVREIAEHYPVPKRLLAEVLKDLARAELVESARGKDGGYTLLSVDTPGENSRSAFADGLEFARPSLAPGDASESASPMRVTLLSSGKERAKGSSTRTQRITGSADIDVCGERLVATVVETVFIASLDAAKARRESEVFVVPGRGIVAERWREKVTVLGIFPKTTEETVVVVPTKGTP